ncbi:MAG: prephenate dehydrogenase/arogenate dehydrogenase family protein [Candidatus Saccharimonadales bacterium]
MSLPDHQPPRPKLAIIGYGDFSKLLIKNLAAYADIVVASRRPNLDSDNLKFEQVDLRTALSQPIIIPSIPAQSLEAFFKDNVKLLNPKALIVDVCSVKVNPVKVLTAVLPASNQILATHPLFGPASAADGLAGKKIMLYPVRLDRARYSAIKRFLADDLKLKIIECTPEEHDRVMAYAQGLSHYIGRLMQIMQIPESELTTSAYDDLKDMKAVQGSDSWELFQSIMLENPYALEVNHQFKQAIKDIDAKLGLK